MSNISDSRFYLERNQNGKSVIKDKENKLVVISNLEEAMYMLNKLYQEQEMMRHILINSDSKDNDFRVLPRLTWNTGCDPK